MKKPRISKKVLETYLQCSRLGPNNCNDIYFAFEDMEQEIARLNKIIKEALYYLEIDMIGTAIDKLKELKEEEKDDI